MLLPLIHSEEISDHEMAYYLLSKYLREHEGYNEIKKFVKHSPTQTEAKHYFCIWTYKVQIKYK